MKLSAVTRGLGLAVVLLPQVVGATVVHQDASEFTLRHEAELNQSSAEVYRALAALPQWWDPAHSYSGSADNFTFELAAGSCFCERWGEASVEHLRVLYSVPEREVRLRGALGPLQNMPVNGLLRWRIVPSGKGAVLTWEYQVWGAASSKLDRMAAAVDRVLAQQLESMRGYLESEAPR